MFKNNWIRVLGVFALFVLTEDVMGSGPGSGLAPIKGIAYQPVPSDYAPCQSCIYFDTDFFNADFTCLWQSGTGSRGDLETVAQTLGANFLHLYNWNPQRNHIPFLNECQTLGLRVAVPFSNFVSNNPAGLAQVIVDIIKEVYGSGTTPHSAVVMWTIANEYDLAGNNVSAGQIAQVAQIILYTEQNIVNATATLSISSPVSFGASGDSNGTPGVKAIHDLFMAFSNTQSFSVTINSQSVTIPALPSDFWETRYVAATNPQNCGSTPECSSGLTIQTYLSTSGGNNSFQSYFCNNPDAGCNDCITSSTGNCFPRTNLWFSEIGPGVLLSCAGWMSPCTTSEQQQANFLKNSLDASMPGTPPFFLGNSVFEFLDETWKGPPSSTNDSTFGITKYSGSQIGTCKTIALSDYPVDNLSQKPSFGVVQLEFKDADNDGIPDGQDLDADNDGIPDTDEVAPNELMSQGRIVSTQTEIPDDPDGDGIPNELDLDSDGDGIPDHFEAGGTNDEDIDGTVDNHTDVDGDGHHDSHDVDQGGTPLPLHDTDSDGIPDFLDEDSDGDGICDVLEARGIDDDGDCIHDDSEDLNADGHADSLHPDTGVPHPPFLDSDDDGIFDHLDSNDNTVQGGGGCSIVSAGVKTSMPLYLLIPLFIVIRRAWGRYRS